MSAALEPLSHLRQLSPSELEDLGQESLRGHLAAQAVVAHQRYAPITRESLERMLQDRECVRYPTRLVFEFGEMAMHQFAQPDVDPRDPTGASRVLYLRPSLQNRPELLVRAVAYMIPALNYGEIITDAPCVSYGAALLGMMEDEYYQQVCALADELGAEPRAPGNTCC
jgi:hypothetical protein